MKFLLQCSSYSLDSEAVLSRFLKTLRHFSVKSVCIIQIFWAACVVLKAVLALRWRGMLVLHQRLCVSGLKVFKWQKFRKEVGGSSKIIQQYNCYYLCVLKRKQCFITELSILLLNFQRTHSHTQMTGSGWVRVSLPSMFHCNQEGECFTHLFENQSARDGIENKVLWWCIEMTIILQTQEIVSLEKAFSDLFFFSYSSSLLLLVFTLSCVVGGYATICLEKGRLFHSDPEAPPTAITR